ncbi:MAG: NADH-quinone oxidoreductase subunit L, partial [Antricoccus sp.]
MTTTSLLAEQYVKASGVFSLSWLLIVLPLVGSIVLLVMGRRADKWGHLFGCGTVIVSFVLGLWMFISLSGSADKAQTLHMFNWVPIESLKIDAGILFDPLSAIFVLLITGVGGLIHIYSIGYMEHDPQRRKFFAYLNLFVAA